MSGDAIAADACRCARFVRALSGDITLTPEACDWLKGCKVWSADAAHAVLDATRYPRLGDAGERERLLAALSARVSRSYRERRQRGAAGRGATGFSGPVGLLAFAWGARMAATGDIDLIAGNNILNNWPIRDQAQRPTCVAFAAAACGELRGIVAGGQPTNLSEHFLYWKIRTQIPPPSPLPPGWDDGATKLRHADAILTTDGICDETLCGYELTTAGSLEGTAPTSAAMTTAAQHRLVPALSWDIVATPNPQFRIAERLYEELAARRPVAIAVPQFMDPDGPPEMTNWWLPSVELTGVVQDPPAGWVQARGRGHAVCVVGFQRDDDEPTGGWFIIRNSVGTDWATGAPDHLGDRPLVPAPGYGALSATYVDGHCWEMLSFEA